MTFFDKLWKKTTYSFFLCLCLILTGCGSRHEAYVSTSATIRDNSPVCLLPVADGITVFGNDYVSVDASHMAEGYIMVSYSGENTKVKMQLTGPDYITYTYNLTGNGYETFPLSAGDGTYQLGVYENVEGSQYATVFSQELSVSITNSMGPFLYPNQYVHFDSSSDVVKEAQILVAGAHDDLEAITAIYNYVISNITYDYDKAQNVQSGYIPDVDEILSIKTGICLDYAAVMSSMLRSQRIPTRLEVGYAGDAYHAWISTYVENQGWVNGIIQFDGHSWSIMDPTFAANSSEKSLKNFIGDGDNYVTKYIY